MFADMIRRYIPHRVERLDSEDDIAYYDFSRFSTLYRYAVCLHYFGPGYAFCTIPHKYLYSLLYPAYP